MLNLVPLCTAVVDVAPTLSIGDTPAGARSVSDIRSVTIEGERVQASLAGGAAADWMVRAEDLGLVDVRMTVRTHDDALIYITYGGRLDLSRPGEGITVVAAPLFETGDARYAWLNRIQAIGKGKLTIGADRSARIDYEFYEVR
uniref:DUF3237 domain-containing protein n=1 Tax=uncultured Sphingomonas sp. TaxID=158754 RepID=UPI0035C9D5C7